MLMNSSNKSLFEDDLSVTILSPALENCKIDVVISGSIAAVETPKFLRCLRRLSAEVFPWLTDGGAMFTTPMSVGWAAGREANGGNFRADASHLATRDACVVAPASANFIRKIAYGIMDDPA